MIVRRATLVLLLAAGCLALLAGPAASLQTTTALDDVADALAQEPVYVDPEAERAISDDAARALADRIVEGGEPIFVAILPAATAEAAGGVEALPTELARATGLAGTYAVVAGDSFRAGGDAVPDAAALATAAFQANADAGTEAVLADFVDRVGQASGDGGALVPGPSATAAPEASGQGGTSEGASDGSSGGVSNVALLALLAAGGGGLFLWSRSRRRRERVEQQRELEADRQLLLAEISVLGDDVMALEHRVTLRPEAREDYDAAVSRFRAAHAALDYARDDVDLVRVERVVHEGQYAMARARALVEGREVPAPPPELTSRGRHDEPALDLDDDGRPVYVGYGTPFYGGGWFGGGGGLFSGLLLGSMLSPMGWGGMWGGGTDVYVDGGGGGDGGGWGDMGGGDWGGGFGGDIGGGDWG